jgi:hypothetical protein
VLICFSGHYGTLWCRRPLEAGAPLKRLVNSSIAQVDRAGCTGWVGPRCVVEDRSAQEGLYLLQVNPWKIQHCTGALCHWDSDAHNLRPRARACIDANDIACGMNLHSLYGTWLYGTCMYGTIDVHRDNVRQPAAADLAPHQRPGIMASRPPIHAISACSRGRDVHPCGIAHRIKESFACSIDACS